VGQRLAAARARARQAEARVAELEAQAQESTEAHGDLVDRYVAAEGGALMARQQNDRVMDAWNESLREHAEHLAEEQQARRAAEEQVAVARRLVLERLGTVIGLWARVVTLEGAALEQAQAGGAS
jgi:hypothetical protein